MAFPFGFYRSPGATTRSLRFETLRSQALDEAMPLVMQAVTRAFRPEPEDQGLESRSFSEARQRIHQVERAVAGPDFSLAPQETVRGPEIDFGASALRPDIFGGMRQAQQAGSETFALSPEGEVILPGEIPVLGPLERFRTRVTAPIAAGALQVAESPVGSLIPGVSQLKDLERRLEGVGVPESVSPLPRSRTFGKAFEGGIVNPFAAFAGDEEAQQRAQEVLAEAGLPRSLAAELVTDPLNLLPVVGFTKADDIARLGRLVVNAVKSTPKARAAAVTALRESGQFQRLLRTAGSEAGGLRLGREAPLARGPMGNVRELNDRELLQAYNQASDGIIFAQAGKPFFRDRLEFFKARFSELNRERSRRFGKNLPGDTSEFTQAEEFAGLDVRLAGDETAFTPPTGPRRPSLAGDETAVSQAGELPPEFGRPRIEGDETAVSGGRIPSLREVEADAFPKFTPEERARFVPETEGVYVPDDFEAVGTRILSGADESVLAFTEKLIRLPGMKQVIGTVNRIAEAATNPVLMARIKGGIFKAIEGNRANLAVTRWKKVMLDAFDWGPDWTASVALKPGVKGVPRRAVGHIEDLLVHTDDYILTDVQRAALDQGRGLRDNMLRQQLQNGVDVLPVQGEYMRRIVTATPEGKVRNGVVPRSGRIGGRKGSQKPRSFKDIRDGFRAGYDYERDPFSLMNLRLREGVTTIADKRALKLVAAEGETVAERVPAHIREEAVASRQRLVEARKMASKKGATEADKTAWEVAKRDHIQARKVWVEVRRRVSEPSWGEVRGPGNRIFDEQFAKELTEWAGSGTESTIQQVNLLVRAFKTTLDFSATTVQLGLTMLTHPIVWAKSSTRGIMSSVADPLTWAHANYEALDEAISFGAAARPTEFLFADAGIASIPTRIPFVGSLFRGSNRAFQWAIIEAQTELWKIYRRGLTTEADLASAAASIRKQTGGLEAAALGTGSKQRALESTVAFAARFFRANVGLLTDLGMRGPRGRIARETLGRFFVAGTTLTLGFNMALNGGKMPNLTDPNKPGWFKVRLGEDSYVSLFGPFYPFMRLVAQDADLLAKGKITELHRPLQFFITSKAGIPFRTAHDLYLASRGTETNVFGDRLPTDPASAAEFAARQFAPIGPEQAAEGLAEGRPEALLETGGINVTPVSPFQQLVEGWERLRGSGSIPDRPFNFETDFNTAEQDKRLAPLVEAIHERSSARGTEGAQRAERISAVRLDLEQRLDLPLLAQGIAQGKPKAASEFAFAWDEYTSQMVGAFAVEYLGVESNRQTVEGRLVQAYREIEMRDFRDPETLEVDRDAFFAAKDSAFAALPRDLQLSIENNIRSENPAVQEAEVQIKEAKRLRSQFYEKPKYLDPGKSDAETLKYEDRLTEFMAFVTQELARAKREFGEDFSLTRPEAAIILGERDFDDKQLGEDAALIFRGKAKRNPDRLQFLDDNQEVLARFFPNLYRLKAARETLTDELFETVIGR